MKRFIALAVLASATTSFAASRNIYDIMYLPNAGTKYGFSELGFQDRTIEARSGYSDVDVNAVALFQTVGYSFTDQFTFNAQLGYISGELDPDQGSKSDVSGFSDLAFNGKFRALEGDFTFDILGGISLSFADREVESDGDRNAQSGGHSFNVGGQLGKKMDNLQWAVQGLLTHNFEADYEESNTNYDLEPSNDLLLRGDLLNKFAESSYLRSFVSVEFDEKVEVDDPSVTLDSPSTTYEIGAEYQHLMSQDLMLRAGLSFQNIQSDSGQTKSDHSWTLNFGANYQF